MQSNQRRMRTIFALGLTLAALGLSDLNARADVSVPSNPVLQPSGGSPSLPPYVATPEQWDLIESYILGIYPDATYGDILFYALSLFNALPPDYSDDCGTLPPAPPCPTPACPTPASPLTPTLPPGM